MPHPLGRNGSFQNIIANLDELEGVNPELASSIRQQEEGQLRLLNEALKSMPADVVIRRLKGVLWRLLPTLRLSEMVQMDFGGEVLSVSLRTALSALVDAVKWIGWKNGIDPLSEFGDDTTIVAIRDMMLGHEPPRPGHDEVDAGLDTGASTEQNRQDDDEI